MKRVRRRPASTTGVPKESAGKTPSSRAAATSGMSKKRMLVGALVAVAIVLIFGLSFQFLTAGSIAWLPSFSRNEPRAVAAFVGSETCASCHASQATLWRGSQHSHAMDHATETSVLGDFSGTSFQKGGVTSRFFRADDKFLVETDGPDGRLGTFEVKYTFGVDPLQQYLIEFPDGRIQALTIAWDSRPQDAGGQRWFSLYPDEDIPPDDILHWTKLNQNWNFMCAGCHSTGVEKNYDAERDSFDTKWAEISVGCETCHGQGSKHVAWARAEQSWWPFGKIVDHQKGLPVRFDERAGASWSPDPATGQPVRSSRPIALRKEVETCGLCHARAAAFSEDWVPGRWLSQTHAVSPLVSGLYHADGQMLGEVYNYGSFKQSKMFAAGVTCSDCHDPHSAELVAAGNGVCLQCHQPAKYEAAIHSRHESVTPPLGCPSCHMPVRTFMVVDPRHDHGFRIPRPDLTVSVGTPNACNDCHADKTAAWAASTVERWFGPDRQGFQTFAAAFDAAWNDRAGAATKLAAIAAAPGTPAIARASALGELAPRLSPENIDLARTGLRDDDPMVRIGALDMIESLPVELRWRLASPLLADTVRGVRLRAVTLLADVPLPGHAAEDRQRFERVADDLVATHKLNADRPESRSALGTFYLRRGKLAEAETEYRAALRLSPRYAGASVNLADLYRQQGQDGRAEEVLRAAIEQSPDDAGLHHALGLTLIRLKRTEQAVPELHRAAALDPANSRYAYVYAVGLHSTGDVSKALATLEAAAARHPEDRSLLGALVAFNRDAGDRANALEYAEELLRLAPDDAQAKALVNELRNGKP